MNILMAEHTFPSGLRMEIAQGDITEEQVDAVVNAANSRLQHGGGVAGAISRSGGPQVQQESDAWINAHGPVTHDRPAYTSGGNLPARYIIHAVGPVWGSSDEEKKLADAVEASLNLANQLKLDSIALPAVSTGIYGFPKKLAARVILETIIQFAAHREGTLRLVRVVLLDDQTAEAFVEAYHALVRP